MRKNIVIGSPKGRFLRFFFDEFAIQIQTSIIHLKFYLSRSADNDSRTFMNLSPTFLKLSPTFFGKSPTFFGKRPTFWLASRRKYVLTSEKHFWGSLSSSFPRSLARARVRAHHRDLVLFAFTTFTDFDVVYCYSVEYKGIRNGVLLMTNKDGIVEAKKGGKLGSSIPPFSSRFVETRCESVKVVKAKSETSQGMRARTRGNASPIL